LVDHRITSAASPSTCVASNSFNPGLKKSKSFRDAWIDIHHEPRRPEELREHCMERRTLANVPWRLNIIAGNAVAPVHSDHDNCSDLLELNTAPFQIAIKMRIASHSI
jgi:hypothetical protein